MLKKKNYRHKHKEDAAHMSLERAVHYQKEGKIDQVKGWRRSCFEDPVFEDLELINVGEDECRERA